MNEFIKQIRKTKELCGRVREDERSIPSRVINGARKRKIGARIELLLPSPIPPKSLKKPSQATLDIGFLRPLWSKGTLRGSWSQSALRVQAKVIRNFSLNHLLGGIGNSVFIFLSLERRMNEFFLELCEIVLIETLSDFLHFKYILNEWDPHVFFFVEMIVINNFLAN